jgi:hypothetical protein
MLNAHERQHDPRRDGDNDGREQQDNEVPLYLRVDVIDDGGRRSAAVRIRTGDLDHAIPDVPAREQQKEAVFRKNRVATIARIPNAIGTPAELRMRLATET